MTLLQQESFRDVKVSPDSNQEQQAQVAALLATQKSILSDLPGKTHLVKGPLRLMSDTPVQVRQYPIAFAIQEPMENEAHQMLQLGVIEPSESPYQ